MKSGLPFNVRSALAAGVVLAAGTGTADAYDVAKYESFFKANPQLGWDANIPDTAAGNAVREAQDMLLEINSKIYAQVFNSTGFYMFSAEEAQGRLGGFGLIEGKPFIAMYDQSDHLSQAYQNFSDRLNPGVEPPAMHVYFATQYALAISNETSHYLTFTEMSPEQYGDISFCGTTMLVEEKASDARTLETATVLFKKALNKNSGDGMDMQIAVTWAMAVNGMPDFYAYATAVVDGDTKTAERLKADYLDDRNDMYSARCAESAPKM